MTSSLDPARLNRLRSVAAERVKQTPLRAVECHLGLPPEGLRRFLELGPRKIDEPHPARRPARRLHSPRSDSLAEEVSSRGLTIGALVRDLPPHRRTEAMRQLLSLLCDEYEESVGNDPSWLERLAVLFDI